jgi:hypothetical protein
LDHTKTGRSVRREAAGEMLREIYTLGERFGEETR